MKMYKIFIPVLLAFFVVSLNSYGQTQNKVADDMAVKLQQKVLLSKDQTAKVKDILNTYLGNINQNSLETAKKSIESILDKRQKAKYDIIKNDWWNSIHKQANAGG
jgi:hypothetical protein